MKKTILTYCFSVMAMAAFAQKVQVFVKDGKSGFIDETGKLVFLSKKYDKIDEFKEGLALVARKADGEDRLVYGFIDKTGKEVISLDYGDALGFSEGLAAVTKGEGWGYIDKTGQEVIPMTYRSTNAFKEGVAVAQLCDRYTQRWGLIDKTGKAITTICYKTMEASSDGLVAVYTKEQKWGFLDQTGQQAIPPTYSSVKSFSDGFALVEFGYEKWGVIDKTGKVITTSTYKSIRPFSEGLAAVELDFQKWGFIDKTGKEITSTYYTYVDNFSDGWAAVSKDGKYSFIDKTGKEVLALSSGSPDGFKHGAAWVTEIAGSYFIDKTGKVCDYIKTFKSGLWAVKENGKWGLMNEAGKAVTTKKYDHITESGGYISWGQFGAVVKKEDKYGFVNPFGVEIIPTKYDFVEPFHNGVAAVRLGDKYGFVNVLGEAITPIQYDEMHYDFSQCDIYKEISESNAGKLTAVREGTVYRITKEGELESLGSAETYYGPKVPKENIKITEVTIGISKDVYVYRSDNTTMSPRDGGGLVIAAELHPSGTKLVLLLPGYARVVDPFDNFLATLNNKTRDSNPFKEVKWQGEDIILTYKNGVTEKWVKDTQGKYAPQ